jgi:hypothetical protein
VDDWLCTGGQPVRTSAGLTAQSTEQKRNRVF